MKQSRRTSTAAKHFPSSAPTSAPSFLQKQDSSASLIRIDLTGSQTAASSMQNPKYRGSTKNLVKSKSSKSGKRGHKKSYEHDSTKSSNKDDLVSELLAQIRQEHEAINDYNSVVAKLVTKYRDQQQMNSQLELEMKDMEGVEESSKNNN